MMDRVKEIVRLHNEADKYADFSNVRRWGEAHLIYEELTSGRSYRALSAAIKEAGGTTGSSIRHLQLMKKCWEHSGKPLWDDGVDDFAKYPPINSLYNSDEVREPSERPGAGERGERERGDGGDGRPDYTSHGLTVRATTAIDALARTKALHATITEEDLALLREALTQLRAFLRHMDGSSR